MDDCLSKKKTSHRGMKSFRKQCEGKHQKYFSTSNRLQKLGLQASSYNEIT